MILKTFTWFTIFQFISIAVFFLLIVNVTCQDPKPNMDRDNAFPWDTNKYSRDDRNNRNRPTTDTKQFFLDSSVHCLNRPITVNRDRRIFVYGKGYKNAGARLRQCTLTLQISNTHERYRFSLLIQALKIHDCDVTFSIIDGRLGETVLETYECESRLARKNYDKRVWTSGNVVTFVLTRKSEGTNYDITIGVEAVRDGSGPECKSGNCHPTVRSYWKFEQKYIVLIIGLCYLVLTIIVISIFMYCLVRNLRTGGKWTHKSFGYNNPALNNSGGSTASGMPANQNVWVTAKPYGKEQLPRSQPQLTTKRLPAPVTKRMTGRNEDDDSVFESDAELIDHRKPMAAPRAQTQKPAATQVTRYVDDDSNFKEADDVTHNRNIEKEIILPDKNKRRKNNESSSSEEYESDTEDQLSQDELDDDSRTVPHLPPRRPRSQEILKDSHQQTESRNFNRSRTLDAELIPPSYQESQGFPTAPNPYPQPVPYRPSPLPQNTTLLQIAPNQSPWIGLNTIEPPRDPISQYPTGGAPSYSYLVRRGFNDQPSPANSAANSNHSREAHIDDTKFSANIDSGVELMKRTTNV